MLTRSPSTTARKRQHLFYNGRSRWRTLLNEREGQLRVPVVTVVAPTGPRTSNWR